MPPGNGRESATLSGLMEIHREEEARLILNEEFQMVDESGQEVTMQGGLEIEES